MRQELWCPAQPDKLKSFACGNYLISYLLSPISPLGVCFMQKSVVLGLSGGVDSAVAASLLLEQGFAVTGLYLDIGLGGTGAADAAAVADRLGIPFETADIRADLEAQVCTPFAAAYQAGRTPLPCALCNPTVKFPALFRLADKIGAPFVSTGHYANVENGVLLRGRPANDQSYMLARLTREQLQRVIFPLGNYEKAEVRQLAKSFGIPVADKPDSMEICFIPDGDYAAWLEARGFSTQPGDFVDKDGRVLAQHGGIHRYTLGQGRGLGVSGPHRYYVSAIRPETNQVVLSDGSDLGKSVVFCSDPNWIGVEGLDGPLEVTVRLRHSRTELPATLSPAGDGVRLDMADPARAPTPGQLAVFYLGNTVAGSAWIEGAI